MSDDNEEREALDSCDMMAHAEPAVAVPEAPKYIVDDEDVSEGHS